MTFEQAQKQFIAVWGAIGTRWGINRTMAEIQALLLTSEKSLSTDEIMSGLDISRGNASMMLRELINWGLVFKDNNINERKEYFSAEKDMNQILMIVMRERRKRELDPIIKMTDGFSSLAGSDKNTKAFKKLIGDIKTYALNADKAIEAFMRMEQMPLNKLIARLIGKAPK